MAPETEPRYIPAARWRAFTRIYDPVLALTMREKRFREEMLRRVEADLPDGGTVVDVGCGTGTFALALKERRPDAQVVGVDGDAEILALAQAKPGAEQVEWREGLAQELPWRREARTWSRSPSSSITCCPTTSAGRWWR